MLPKSSAASPSRPMRIRFCCAVPLLTGWLITIPIATVAPQMPMLMAGRRSRATPNCTMRSANTPGGVTGHGSPVWLTAVVATQPVDASHTSQPTTGWNRTMTTAAPVSVAMSRDMPPTS